MVSGARELRALAADGATLDDAESHGIEVYLQAVVCKAPRESGLREDVPVPDTSERYRARTITSGEAHERITMSYYGGKELAAAFRTVRNNTIQIAEEIPDNKY